MVSEVLGSGAQPQLLIKRPERDSAMVPIVPEIFTSYDAERQIILIDPPAGLLDLDRT